ncbi:MAG: hypothetical protein Q8928_01070 [Bacteroidota bacterium]|nr:hypothetical protein [Bacteroidota bacterium]
MKLNLPYHIVTILFTLFFYLNLSAQNLPETGEGQTLISSVSTSIK